MDITISETGEKKVLLLSEGDVSKGRSQEMSQADYDWFVSALKNSRENNERMGGIGYFDKYPLELLAAIINEFYKPENDAEENRLHVIKNYFDDTDDSSYHQVKNLEATNITPNSDAAGEQVERYKISFTLTNVLVPVESDGGVIFKKTDLDVEAEGDATEFYIDSNRDSIVIKTPYYKDSSKHLSYAAPSWAEDYFEYLVFWASNTDHKSIGEQALDLIKQKPKGD